jgi:copper chaperone
MKLTIHVEGMSCQHCVKRVKNAIQSIEGVSNVEVSLEQKSAVILFDETKVKISTIAEAVEETGYHVVK